MVDDWDNFKKITTRSRKAWKAAYNKYVQDYASPGDNSNPKKLFTYIKSRNCDRDGVAPLQQNGKIHIDSEKKAS